MSSIQTFQEQWINLDDSQRTGTGSGAYEYFRDVIRNWKFY